MKTELLVFQKVFREKFLYEDFIQNDYILGIVKAGSFVFDDGNGEIEVAENECILFQKGVRYLRHVTRPVEMFLFRFTIDVNIFTSGKLMLHSSEWLSGIIACLDELYSGLYAEEMFCQHAILDSILSLAIMADAQQKQKSISQDNAVDRFLRIIHSGIQTKLNLPAIAQELGMSYVQLLRRFEGAVGVTPSEYIIIVPAVSNVPNKTPFTNFIAILLFLMQFIRYKLVIFFHIFIIISYHNFYTA
jgi:hypothetical protein